MIFPSRVRYFQVFVTGNEAEGPDSPGTETSISHPRTPTFPELV